MRLMNNYLSLNQVGDVALTENNRSCDMPILLYFYILSALLCMDRRFMRGSRAHPGIHLTISGNSAFQVNRFRLLPPLPFLFFNWLAEKAAKWLTFLALFATHGTRQPPFFPFTLTHFFVFANSVNSVHCVHAWNRAHHLPGRKQMR